MIRSNALPRRLKQRLSALCLHTRFTRLLQATALAALTSLAACGGGGGSTSTATAGETTNQPAPTTPDTGSGSSSGSGSGSSTTGATYVVGSSADLPTGATRVAQLTDVPWANLPVGSLVIVSAGTYAGPVTINAQGSASAPIVVRAADSANLPIVTNSVDVQGAGWVQISGLSVRAPTWAGFVVRRGSHDIRISDSIVRNAPIGFDVSDGAGTGLVIANNLVEDTATQGIGVSTNAVAGNPNIISGNTVRRSGQHGMEIRGNWWLIEHNNVSRSGLAIGGASGIHLWASSATDDAGDHNTIRYNLSFDNVDTLAHDGNGIQIDQWCDGNTVAWNMAWGNDGAGIIIYDGNDNRVMGNTLRGNGLDSGGTHGGLGELIIAGSPALDRTSGNQVWNNIAVSTRSAVPAMWVDGRAWNNSNVLGPNWLHHTAGGTHLRWADNANHNSAAAINSVTGTSGNLVEAPQFSNAAAPASGGWRLTTAPTLSGTAMVGDTDFGGTVGVAGMRWFGAYFSTP